MFIADDLAAGLVVLGLMAYKKFTSKPQSPTIEGGKKTSDRKIFVFGNKQSGKTTLLKAIGASLPEGATSIVSEKYDSFSVKNKDGISLTVLAGTDVNGDETNINNGKILKLLKENDRFIYTFDESLFLDAKNRVYKNMVIAHIGIIYDFATSTNTLERVRIVGTHVDKCINNRELTKEQVSNIFSAKVYFEKFKSQFSQHNLTDEKEKQDIINEIFE